MEMKLNRLQAFNAMAMLFDIYYLETLSNDLGGILGSMSFSSDHSTADSAMWEVWNENLNKILDEKNIKNQNQIKPLHAFLAIKLFLEYFFETEYSSKEILFFINNINLAYDQKEIDPFLLKNWSKCIHNVLLIKDSRDYLNIFE